MKLEVLISCMNETDTSIIQRENIQTDALVINQCDRNATENIEFINKKGEKCLARFIHTTERGLSRSRNLAVNNSIGDICLICDDDEELEDDYEDKILNAFYNNPNYQILAFKLKREKKYKSREYEINYFNIGPVGSVQLACRKNFIVNIPFSENMGSGTGNGGGEESKFLVDSLKKGAKIKYLPICIASLEKVDSQWFHGHTEKYWCDRGWSARMIYGYLWGYLYMLYTLFFRAKKIDAENSWFKILRWINKGFFDKR